MILQVRKWVTDVAKITVLKIGAKSRKHGRQAAYPGWSVRLKERDVIENQLKEEVVYSSRKANFKQKVSQQCFAIFEPLV